MLGVVIKADDVAGLGLEGDGGDLVLGDVPLVLAVADYFLQPVGVALALAVAAGDYAQRAAVAGQWVEVEGDFEVRRVADFLEIALTSQRAEEVAAATSFDSMKRRGEHYAPTGLRGSPERSARLACSSFGLP